MSSHSGKPKILIQIQSCEVSFGTTFGMKEGQAPIIYCVVMPALNQRHVIKA